MAFATRSRRYIWLALRVDMLRRNAAGVPRMLDTARKLRDAQFRSIEGSLERPLVIAIVLGRFAWLHLSPAVYFHDRQPILRMGLCQMRILLSPLPCLAWLPRRRHRHLLLPQLSLAA